MVNGATMTNDNMMDKHTFTGQYINVNARNDGKKHHNAKHKKKRCVNELGKEKYTEEEVTQMEQPNDKVKKIKGNGLAQVSHLLPDGDMRDDYKVIRPGKEQQVREWMVSNHVINKKIWPRCKFINGQEDLLYIPQRSIGWFLARECDVKECDRMIWWERNKVLLNVKLRQKRNTATTALKAKFMGT